MFSRDGKISRRDVLQTGALAAAALGLPSMKAEGSNPLPRAVAASPAASLIGETLSLDAARVPLSRFGSYLAVSHHFWPVGVSLQPSAPDRVAMGEYYIRCLQDDPGPPEVFRIEMVKDGKPVVPVAESTPGKYTLRNGDAKVEFCIAENDVVRVRGSGCELRLYGVTSSYANAVQQSADSWLVTPDPMRSNIQLKRLAGTMKVDAPWVERLLNVQVDKVIVTLASADAAPFECSLLFYESVPRQNLATVPFDQAVGAVETEFEKWASGIAPLQPRYEPARKLAAYVLWSDTVSARGLYPTPIVWGSKNWMARIWSWDHCFCALGLAQSHPDLAWQQFMVFKAMQDPESGMLADSMSNIKRSWCCTKNPVHGWTLSHLLRLMPESISRERLQEAYVPLSKWTEFWTKYRDFDGDGLPCIVHPDESFDNTTNNSLSAPGKPPETATYLVLQMDALAEVARRLGYTADAQRWHERSERLVQAMLRVLWDEKRQRFVSKRIGDGYVAPGDCVLTYMPLLLGDRLPPSVRKALISGLTRPGAFVTPYGFSTEALDSPFYNGDSYVKGPTWAPLNTLLIEGLHKVGEADVARKVQVGFCDTVLRGGMSEHFDARTGAPQGDPSYIWTPALFLLLASRNQDARLIS